MSEPFIAEVRIFASTFAPRGWAACDGQLLPIAQNTALYDIIGTIYGGDGATTFGLPDLEGRAPMHPGTGPGLSSRVWGEKGGVESVALDETQMGSHGHNMRASSATANHPGPDYFPASGPTLASSTGRELYASAGDRVAMADEMLDPAGSSGGGGHNNMQPYLVLNFVIALVGLTPPR